MSAHSSPAAPKLPLHVRRFLPLLGRELQAAIPWVSFFLGMTVVALVQGVFLDGDTIGVVLGVDDGSYARLVSWMAVFAMGVQLALFDDRHGTEAFLETLPVSRRERFVVRVLSGVVVVVALNVVNVVVAVVAGLRDARHLIDPELPWQIIALTAMAWIIRDLSALAMGFLCSGLRQLSWMLLVVWVMVLFGIHLLVPGKSLWTPMAMGVVFPVAGRVVVHWGGVVLHVVVTVVAFALAVGLRADTGARAATEGLPRWRRLLHSRLTVAAGFALMAFVYWRFWQAVPDAPRVVTTERLIVTTRPVQSVAAMARDADLDTAYVEQQFGVVFPRHVRVAATGQLENAHGKAHGLAIALSPQDLGDRFVLTHELAHAAAWLLSEGVTSRDSSLSAFNEGLANAVARRRGLTAPSGHGDPHTVVLPLYRQRLLTDELLTNPSAAIATGGEGLPYALGELFIQTLIDLYGEDAPNMFLQALPASYARGHRGIALWRDAHTAAGLSFEFVRAQVFARVKDAADNDDDDADADAEKGDGAGDVAKKAKRPSRRRPLVSVADLGSSLTIDALDEHGAVISDGVTCVLRELPDQRTDSYERGCHIIKGRLVAPVVEVQVVVTNADGEARSAWTRIPIRR
jgi:hypothetical protein